MDTYRRVFVESWTAPLLSRPNPLRRSGFDMDLLVERIEREAQDVVSLTLRAPAGDRLPQWSPGSHLDLILPSGRQRQYSLCGDPGDRTGYRIAVRRIAAGGGGSIEVHERVRAGDHVRVRGPRNAFSLVDAPSYLFIAAGIGITPILPMVTAAGARGRLVYLGRTRASMPFLNELPADAEIRPDDEYGVPDVAALMARAEPGAAVYVCGPPPVLAAAQECMFTLNPTGSLHAERFSAAPVVGGRDFDLTLARTGKTLRVGADETALAAIRRELPDAVYSCQQGFCGTCKTRVLSGAVDHRDRLLPDSQRHDQMLTCVSRAVGDSLVLDL
ncbi:PDR/VanB family oxidoreductase [Mycolicibacter sp. MYC098]|uniref:PDR/VanB family oxidoreductase n=2 Tax=[Mycobacterium] crassicus TaxID=2872309 RepID=A0ABU5XKM8_9MYCO|nr:PDR/VanB family oxidoreductase [Mycolicibacter sp. MYC098]MEB3022838.1 PDR/VanB family oxidoreductase [Mycolicibacter sp. MYC098]